MTSPNDITLEHIDPLNSDHICGLRVPSNEVMAEGSYNYAKANKFVPYRVNGFPAPVNPGDLCEFLFNGEWVVSEFFGADWHKEARRIGCSSNKNRVCHTNPELHKKISRKGAQRSKELNIHFGTNGCHTSQKQRDRIIGKKWWYNPETDHQLRSPTKPGPNYRNQRRPK